MFHQQSPGLKILAARIEIIIYFLDKFLVGIRIFRFLKNMRSSIELRLKILWSPYFSGFERNFNGTCQDVDECAGNMTECQENSSCFNIFGSAECRCDSGYLMIDDLCEDIDECAANLTDICPENSKCVNNVGSFYCECTEGYWNNLTSNIYCDDFDECANMEDLCGKFETCQNTVGSYECHCSTGYKLIDGKCDGKNLIFQP